MSKIAEAAFGDKPYPETPGFQNTDTSKKAAANVAPDVSAQRERIWRHIANAGPAGKTADEVAAELGLDILYVRPRVTELKTMLRLKDSGQRRKNHRDNRTIVLVANHAGGR